MKNNKACPSLRVILACFLILLGLVVLIAAYGPILIAELRFAFRQRSTDYAARLAEPIFQTSSQSDSMIEPVDEEFGIVIPKINVNAPIVEGVDPYSSFEYQRQLAKGVAQAAGTGLPDQERTMFLFAHASGDILMARRYNSVFYLLNKLAAGDQLVIYYRGAPYYYQITASKEVAADAVNYLETDQENDLILMTCTPPGTTWRRLLVFADQILP
jgi:LPXTG-site transpeptidase (sortase) family protein